MDFASQLKMMKVQSATTIAIESMKYLRSLGNFGIKFNKECNMILKARPTAVVLSNSIERVKKYRNKEEIGKIINELENAKEKTAGNTSRIFHRKCTVLTHCHSTFVVAALVRNKSRIKEVIVTETRPKDQGILTARELLRNKIKVSYIVDSAISDFIGKADMVVVGADALRKEGLINKVGTHPLALVAKENKKPFYVITSSFTMDSRRKFLMEQRPRSELTHKHLNGAKIFNPAFDITPWKYVTAIITEKGITKPQNLRRQS